MGLFDIDEPPEGSEARSEEILEATRLNRTAYGVTVLVVGAVSVAAACVYAVVS